MLPIKPQHYSDWKKYSNFKDGKMKKKNFLDWREIVVSKLAMVSELISYASVFLHVKWQKIDGIFERIEPDHFKRLDIMFQHVVGTLCLQL